MSKEADCSCSGQPFLSACLRAASRMRLVREAVTVTFKFMNIRESSQSRDGEGSSRRQVAANS